MKILDNFQVIEFFKSFHFAGFSECLRAGFEEMLQTLLNSRNLLNHCGNSKRVFLNTYSSLYLSC